MKGLLQGVERECGGGTITVKKALTINSGSFSRVRQKGSLFYNEEEIRLEKSNVGKQSEKVAWLDNTSKNIYLEAHVYSRQAVCWMRLRMGQSSCAWKKKRSLTFNSHCAMLTNHF